MPLRFVRTRWLVAIVASALVVTGSIAYATIPDSGGVIHTCFTKSSGAWRVIDTGLGQTCKSNEAALDLYAKDGADAAFLDPVEGDARYLGKTAKAADSDKLDGKDSAEFLGVGETAADSSRLGGFKAFAYVLGGGVLLSDAGNLPDGGSSSFTCCEELGITPPRTIELRCDTDGNTRLVASSPAGGFRWWWDGTSGDAQPVSSGGFEAQFAIGNGVERNSLRITDGLTVLYDLDTSIGATCHFGWTRVQAYHATPGP